MEIFERNIISIQSLVSAGYVGNSVAGLAIQLHGINPIILPTVMLSSHAEQNIYYGDVVSPDLFKKLIRGISEVGLREKTKFAVSGYINTSELIDVTAEFITGWKKVQKEAIYIYDPVLGDTRANGLYIPEAIAKHSVATLLPLCDVLTPNQFELEFIVGQKITTEIELTSLIADHPILNNKRVILTSAVLADTPAGQIEVIVVENGQISRFSTENIHIEVVGTGDLFTAIMTSQLANGRKVGDAIQNAMNFVCSVLTFTKENGLTTMSASAIMQAYPLLLL
ncbi:MULTISPECIES: pyridoxal kinase [unclassified Myroides]|uniref:pyridoxal kinase n=1 Tax=unclassified Myroides TaxID=2642485 RepID=UPI00310132DC